MDQSLVDSAVRRLKVRNNKQVNLTKKYFSDLSHLVSSSMNSLATFSPGRVDPLTLRHSYMPMYKWMAVQLTDLYNFPVDAELLTGLKFTSDLTDGVIEIKVIFAFNRKNYTFTITFNDEGAPYSTNWAELLNKAGGNGERFSQLMQLV